MVLKSGDEARKAARKRVLTALRRMTARWRPFYDGCGDNR